MPLNHLELQPQIKAYARKAGQAQASNRQKLAVALDLLHGCAAQPIDALRSQAAAGSQRCALPAHERVDLALDPPQVDGSPIILAADGSQIVPSLHDAVPLALINTSRICLDSAGQAAPQVSVTSRILEDETSNVEIALMSEDLVNLKRDVSELEVLLDWQTENESGQPVIALRDGPLELYHEPRQGDAFNRAFAQYKQLLKGLEARGFILAGYIDRTRATLISQLLDIYKKSLPDNDTAVQLGDLPDSLLMDSLLAPGQRSAIFELHSSASQHYEGGLSVHFFYLNVGRAGKPYSVRVEIPQWITEDPGNVNLLQHTLLAQCSLMGARPYPYLLHRAHEEAVVHFDEKENLQTILSAEMQQQGIGLGQPSNKQSAKALQPRTRM